MRVPPAEVVLIPDLWGESSDMYYPTASDYADGLNPRFVGRVFRPTLTTEQLLSQGLNPRFVGRVFRLLRNTITLRVLGLNPRFVGRVFRRTQISGGLSAWCLNPRFVGRVFRPCDLLQLYPYRYVLIPDLWGESSDSKTGTP